MAGVGDLGGAGGVLLQVQFVEALPRTSVGKLNKRVMREEDGPA